MASSTIAELLVRISADASNFSSTMRNLSGSAMRTAQSFTQTGNVLTQNVTKPIIGMGIDVLKTAADFQTAMNRVSALAGATGGDLDKLTKQAKDLGRTTQFSASQAGEAMGFLAMSGMKTTDILGAMPSVLQLAASAQLDLGRAADITTNIMSGYQMSIKELAGMNDVLVKAFTNSNTDLSMLGESFKYMGPIAKNAGFAFEEIAAATGILGTNSVQASMAGTSLRKMILSLQAPAKAGQKVMDRLGFSAYDNSGKMKGMYTILTDLKQGWEKSGASAQQMASDMKKLFGTTAVNTAQILMDNTENLKTFTGELQNSGGTASKIAEVQMQGLNGAMKSLSSAIEGAKIAFADSGLIDMVTGIVEGIVPLIRAFGELPTPVKQVIIVIAGIVAALGPLLIIVGMVASGIGALSGFGAILAGVFSTIAAIIAAIGAPILIVIAAIGLLVGAIVYLWKTNETFRNAIISIWQTVSTAVVNSVKWLVEKIVEFFTWLYNVLIGNSIIPDLVNGIIGFFAQMVTSLIEKASAIKDSIVNAFTSIKDTALSIVSQAKNWGANIIGNIANGIRSGIGKVSSAASNVASKIKGFFPNSPVKEGPLTVLPSLGKNITNSISKGMMQNIPTINNSLNKMNTTPITRNMYSTSNSNNQGSTTTINHTGIITVKGVNNKDELIGTTELIGEEINYDQQRYATTPSPRRIFK